ncbi:MAG: hypothetical protein AB7O38_26220 [Pirellulaceae bacterium]
MSERIATCGVLLGLFLASPVPAQDDREAIQDAISTIRSRKGSFKADSNNRVIAVNLQSCSISEDDLETIAALHFVEDLNLRAAGSGVTTAGLQQLKAMPQLKRLNLMFCRQFRSASLQPLADLKSLEAINLSHIETRDENLVHLKGLTKLRELDLTWSETKSLDSLKDLTNLEVLVLHQVKTIDDEDARILTSMTKLRRLDLAETQITAATLPLLAEMKDLEFLDFTCGRFDRDSSVTGAVVTAAQDQVGTRISPDGPYNGVTVEVLQKNLGGLKNLRSLRLNWNKFKLAEQRALSRAFPQTTIEFSGGKISPNAPSR